MTASPQAGGDLRHYLRAFWRGKFLFLGAVVSLPIAAYLLTSRLPETYESAVVLQVGATTIDTTLFQESAPPSGSTAQAVRLMQTTGVAEEAASKMENPPSDPGELLDKVQVEGEDSTNFVTITARDGEPREAADIANSFADAVVSTRKDAAVQRVTKAITTIDDNIANLPPSDVDGRRQLSQQLQRLRALRAAQGSNTTIVEPAIAPTEAVSPNPERNAAIAAIVGILLGLSLVAFADRLDRRVRQPSEIEHTLDAPLLAIIPENAFPGNAPSAQVKESFQTLRTSLTYFNVDQPITSVIVTSALKEDGKTTVATNLAAAMARTGKAVLLVDTDLRRPQVGTRMGLKVEFGLGDVLAGERTLDETLLTVNIGSGEVTVLPAGPPPPNPSELLASQRMRALFAEISERFEFIVIDSTPLLPVSDAIPLLDQASGTVVVGRVNRTTREALHRLRHVLGTAQAHVLGVVATGAAGQGLYEYGGYGYGYGSTNGAVERGAGDELQPGSNLEPRESHGPINSARRLIRRS